MHLSDTVDALAVAMIAGRGRIDTLAHRLQNADLIPRGRGGSNRPVLDLDHVVNLLLSHIVGVGYGRVAEAVVTLRAYGHASNRGHGTAGEYLTHVLRTLIVGENGMARHFGAASVSITNGTQPAIVVRFPTSDGDPAEMAFTPDGTPWRPDAAETIFETIVIPGSTLVRIADALRPLARGIL